jgi:hypothetical protein
MSQPITVDRVIAKYMGLRNEKDAINAEAKAKTDKLVAAMDKLEAYIKQRAKDDGVTSFKTPHGTAFLTTVDFANVENWDAVLQFVKDRDAYDILERRVSKTAIRSYIDTDKEVPPGVKYGTRLEVNVRKPANKGE